MNIEVNLENGSWMFLEVMLIFCIMNSNIIERFDILLMLMLEIINIIYL